MSGQARLKLLLDEGVTVSAGEAFRNAGHEVISFRDALVPGSPDQLVCATAELNDAILVAHDQDMKVLAKRRGISARRFRTLSLIKLSCREGQAARRIMEAMSLIESEWARGQTQKDRRLFIDLGKDVIRIYR